MSINQGETFEAAQVNQFIDEDAEQVLYPGDHNGDEQKSLTFAAIRNLVDHRLTRFPSSIVLVQLFLALGWSRAVAEKVVDPNWWSGETVRAFIVDTENPIDWYRPFAESVLLQTAVVVSALTLTIQIGIALTMLSGRFLRHGVAAGIFLNLNFLALGEINPSVFYLVLQGTLAFWIAENSSVPPNFTVLRTYAALALALAVACIPFIKTLQPGEVLEDTAIMITSGGILVAMACDLASRRLYGSGILSLGRRSTDPETVG